MTLSTQQELALAEFNATAEEALFPETLMKVWCEDFLIDENKIRPDFETRIVELAKGCHDKFIAEYSRGIAWLCVMYAGLIDVELIAKLKLIPLFKKHYNEFDIELNFEDAVKEGNKYFPDDKFEMIGELL